MCLLFKSASVLLISLSISSCAIHGSYINDDAEYEKLNGLDIEIHSLTASNISSFKEKKITARSNMNLDFELSEYEYRVGPGDILNVIVWDHPELTIPAGGFRSNKESGNWVQRDGSIFYPYIGTVYVEGQTVNQIRETIRDRLSKYIESPQVDVNIAAFRSQTAYITGEVKQPGKQPITNIPLTVLDAINLAGGLAKNADWKNVVLTRNGHEKSLSLYALMQFGDMEQNYLLKPGDIIHVPRNDSQKVFVMGEVNMPKLLLMDRVGMSLTEALSLAGGLDKLVASATGVFVIRNARNDNTLVNAQIETSEQDKGTQKNEPMVQIEKLAQSEQTDPIGKLEQVEPTEQTAKLEQIKLIEQFKKLEQIGPIKQLENLSQIGPLRQSENLEQHEINPFGNQDAIAMASIKQKVDVYQLNIQNASALVLGTEFQLKPKDIVYVTAAPIAKWNRLVLQLLPTLTGVNQISEASLNIKTLSQ